MSGTLVSPEYQTLVLVAHLFTSFDFILLRVSKCNECLHATVIEVRDYNRLCFARWICPPTETTMSSNDCLKAYQSRSVLYCAPRLCTIISSAGVSPNEPPPLRRAGTFLQFSDDLFSRHSGKFISEDNFLYLAPSRCDPTFTPTPKY